MGLFEYRTDIRTVQIGSTMAWIENVGSIWCFAARPHKRSHRYGITGSPALRHAKRKIVSRRHAKNVYGKVVPFFIIPVVTLDKPGGNDGRRARDKQIVAVLRNESNCGRTVLDTLNDHRTLRLSRKL